MTDNTNQEPANKYKSLLDALENSDFTTMLEYFDKYYIDKPAMKELLVTSKVKPINELNLLLNHLPKYSIAARTRKQIELNEPVEFLPDALKVAELLLKLGANPNQALKNGISPYLLSAKINNPDLLKLFLDNPYQPANLDAGDGRGWRSLHYAAMAQANLVVDELVNERKMDINRKYILSENKTIFHLLCANVKIKSIEQFMQLGANPTLQDNFQNLPEHQVPVYNPKKHEKDQFTPEEMALWEVTYQAVENYRVEYEKTHKKSHKVKF
jgi:ankyrin repeat protein